MRSRLFCLSGHFNNKAWASAETVRRELLVELLSRKTLPKDAAAVIAQGLTAHHRAVGRAVSEGNTLAHTLLGIERAKYREGDKLAQIVEQNPAKAQHVSLAVVLGGIEQATSKNTWCYPEAVYAHYFQQLTVWGHPQRRRTDHRRRRQTRHHRLGRHRRAG